MPVLGLVAIVRSLRRLARVLWQNEAFHGLVWITAVTLFFGTWFFKTFEPTITTWVDAYYFTVITLTTIGYGDMGPTIPFTRIFTTFYVFVGLGIIAGLIGIVGEAVIEDSKNRTSKEINE